MPDRSSDPNIDRFFEHPGARVKLKRPDGTIVKGAHWPTSEEITELACEKQRELDANDDV
jgi:hypothetical protein